MRKKWAIQVVNADGDVMYLRHGRTAGKGRIVQFHSRSDAEMNAEAMIAPGLDEGDRVTAVLYSKDYE